MDTVLVLGGDTAGEQVSLVRDTCTLIVMIVFLTSLFDDGQERETNERVVFR